MTAQMNMVVDQARLRQIRANLKAAGEKRIAREFNRALKDAAKPVAEDEKRAALAIKAKGPKSTGLRQGLADGVRIGVRTSKTTAGVRILTKAKLAKASRNGKWRHPVFGDRTVWVFESLAPGWFSRTARRHRTEAAARIHVVIDAYAKRIGI